MYCIHDNYPSTCPICANQRNSSTYCRTCKTMTNHHEFNCPYQVHASIASVNRTRACRALGCTDCRPGQTHYCSVCRDNDSTHRSRNCPLASQCLNVSNNAISYMVVNPTPQPQIAYVRHSPSLIAVTSGPIPMRSHVVQSQPVFVIQNGHMMYRI